MSEMDALIEALERQSETNNVDFKSLFDVSALRDWLELIKDIVAFANSGGGFILVGLENDGAPSGADVSSLLAVDPADIANRIYKYIGQHFSGFELIKCEKEGHDICAIKVSAVHVPIVFTRVGEIEIPEGKKKTSFAIGTVYFRHAAKSEPGTSDDLRQFLDRELELTRKSWLDGIAKVVEAPPGSRFEVLLPEVSSNGSSSSYPIQLTSDPNAQAYYAVPIDQTHPHRQKEVIQEVNARLEGRNAINTHDLLCIRRVYAIEKQAQYCYIQKYASPRYTTQFVDWIIEHYNSNPKFFEESRTKFNELKLNGA